MEGEEAEGEGEGVGVVEVVVVGGGVEREGPDLTKNSRRKMEFFKFLEK